MSSTEQINNLIASQTQLADAYDGAYDLVTASLDTAEQRVGETRREFWVNQVSGDDANDGSAAHPLASLLEVNERSVWAGVTRAHIVGDYEMRERFTMRFHALILSGDNGTFDFAADSTNSPGTQPGFICYRTGMPDCSVVFDDFTINLPSDAGEEGVFINTGFIRLALRDVIITLGAGATRVFSSGTGAIGITTSSVSFPAEMAGRWVDTVAAGETPSTAKRVAYSSMSTL